MAQDTRRPNGNDIPSTPAPRERSEAHYVASQLGYAIAIAVNLFVLYVLHNLVPWGVPFVTEAFDEVLWAFDLSVGANIVANLIYLAYDARWLRRIGQVVLNGFALVSLGTLYQIFPFALPPIFEPALRVALLLSMVGVLIATVVEMVKLLAGSER